MRKNFKGHYQNPKTNLKKGSVKPEKPLVQPKWVRGHGLLPVGGGAVKRVKFTIHKDQRPEFHNYMKAKGYEINPYRHIIVLLEFEDEYWDEIRHYSVPIEDYPALADDLESIGIKTVIAGDRYDYGF